MTETEKTDIQSKKKATLDNLYHDIGKQKHDFEVCSLYKDSEGATGSRWTWEKYTQICFDIEKNKIKFEQINCRTILPCEIVLDLEDKEGIINILNKLERFKFCFDCYDTGSRGYHIHLFFGADVTEKEKERFIEIFGADMMKKSNRNVIALENYPHWKTGKIKSIFKRVEGINTHKHLVDFLDSYIPDEYLEILKDKNLLDRMNNELDKEIVGEKETRKVISLCASGRLVENHDLSSYNLMVHDTSGTGKDFTVSHTLCIIPKSQYVRRTRITPATFTYWHNGKLEPDWTWNGKVFYCEDISDSVLNSEVFKVMCSSGSETTVVIKQKAIDIHIEGKPVIIITAAAATPNSELVRRFAILNLDSTEAQTRAIMKRKSLEASEGIKNTYDERIIVALSFLKRVRVRIPFAVKIDKFFPEKNVIMRTNYTRFLDYIKASCALHQFQRQKDEKGFLLADKEDYEIARLSFLKLFSNKFMLSLTKNQKNIFDFFIKNPSEEFSATEIKTKGIVDLTLKSLIFNLDRLVGFKLLQQTRSTDSLNREIDRYLLDSTYDLTSELVIPKFEELDNVG